MVTVPQRATGVMVGKMNGNSPEKGSRGEVGKMNGNSSGKGSRGDGCQDEW